MKYRTPLYEVNQILHAHAIQNGATLAWATFDPCDELTAAFDKFKTENEQ